MKKLKVNKLRQLKPKPLSAENATKRWGEAYIDYLRSECHLAENTVMAYGRDMKRFTKWLGKRQIPRLTVSELADFVGHLSELKLAPASIARHIVAIKMFFRYLQLEGVLVDNKVELLGSQKLWQRVPEVLSPKAIDLFLNAPSKGELYYFRDRALLEMLYATGCRASEISNLRLRDVHLKERFCKCHGKGSKQRMAPLGDAAIAAVTEYLERQTTESGSHSSCRSRLAVSVARRKAIQARGDLGTGEEIRVDRRGTGFDQPAHDAPQLRHSFIGRRSRFTPSPGNAGACEHLDDADLHARRSNASEESPQTASPAGLISR